MAYLLPSFFQKRILRYALSRLELLDTDALDLEKLDIEWGRRSTVELRDVGIHTKVSRTAAAVRTNESRRHLSQFMTDHVLTETCGSPSLASKPSYCIRSDSLLAAHGPCRPLQKRNSGRSSGSTGVCQGRP